ncbi:hypothetical protein NVS55_07740 [Myxococcus stipitatus]|uniref:tetratricopeptide repeat protein n=1 Tax=Myxococcus stipitatus TaxID=83455 RepID=UPI0031456F7F
MARREELLAERDHLEPETGFTRLSTIADHLEEMGCLKDAADIYWSLVPDGYRLGAKCASELLKDGLWSEFERGDFHEFGKWANSIPSTSKVGDRENLADIISDLGWNSYQEQDFPEAERLFRMALALRPWDPRSALWLGRALEKQAPPLRDGLREAPDEPALEVSGVTPSIQMGRTAGTGLNSGERWSQKPDSRLVTTDCART